MPLASCLAPESVQGAPQGRGRLQGRGLLQVEEQRGRVEQVEEQLGRVARQVRADLPLLLLLLPPSPLPSAWRPLIRRGGASSGPPPAAATPPPSAEKGNI